MIPYRVVCCTALFTAVVGVASARAACTNADLIGPWGIESTQRAGHPGVGVAQLTFDGAGNVTGSVTASEDGSIITGVLTGTYSLAKNCTGTVTLDFAGLGTSTASIVLHAGKKALEIITTEDGIVESAFGLPQGAITCGFTGKKETFASSLAGVVPGTGPVAGVGQFVLKGDGNLTGTITFSNQGTLYKDVPVTGTYTENADCSGTATLSPSGFPPSHYSLAIVDTRKTILIIQTDSGTVIAGTLQK